MKAIWAHDEATYIGRYVSFERIWSYPKPAQRPHPPVLVGGMNPKVLERVLAFGDGWMPIYAGEVVLDRVKELRARAERPSEVQMTAVPADPRVLERLNNAGVRRALCYLPSGPLARIMPALEKWERAIAEYKGE